MGISEHANRAFQEAKTAAELSWESFADFSREKKDQAAAFLEKQSDRFDDRFENYEERADDVAEQSKEAYRNSLESLREQRAELEAQIDKLRNASGENWEETKQETKQKWNAFIDNMQQFSERFKVSDPEA